MITVITFSGLIPGEAYVERMGHHTKRSSTTNGHGAVSIRLGDRTAVHWALTSIAPPPANDGVAALVSKRAESILRRLVR